MFCRQRNLCSKAVRCRLITTHFGLDKYSYPKVQLLAEDVERRDELGTGTQDGGERSQKAASELEKTFQAVKMKMWEPQKEVAFVQQEGRITADLVEQVLARQHDAGKALAIYKWAGGLEGYSHTQAVYRLVIERLGAAKKFSASWCVVEDMRNRGVEFSPSIFVTIMKSYAAAGLVERAIETLDRMAGYGFRPTLEIYACLLNLTLYAHRHQESRRLYRRMLDESLSPDKRIYDTIVCGLCQTGDSEAALKFFHRMKTEGHVPDLRTYSILVKRFCMIGRVAEARNLLSEMERDGLTPSVFIYNLLINAFCKEHRMADAASLLREMKLAGRCPDVVTYNTVLDAFFKLGKHKRAFRLFKQMLNAGYIPDECTRRILLMGLLKVGKLRKAMNLLDTMIIEGLPLTVDSCNAILHGLCLKDLIQAEEFFNRMVNGMCQPDVVSYTTLLQHLCKECRVVEAEKLFLQMKDMGITPNAVSYSALISVFCRMHKGKEASKLVREMLQMGCTLNDVTCNVLIKNLGKGGLVDDALEVCDRILCKRLVIDPDKLQFLLQALSDLGRGTEGRQLLKDLARNGCLEEPYASCL